MSSIFKLDFNIEQLHDYHRDSIVALLGIEYVEKGDDYLIARMPVDARTVQPYGILHGGASVTLAETLGSIASFLTLDPSSNQTPVGIEVNANHIKSVKSGWVYGKVTPVHLGRKTHVWDIRITDENKSLVCVSRLTVMIIDKK
ncbi:MAG: hotdog fold thioesterase [Acidobacteria bacterium]|nr:hotdog fold thioesterase [Acidobacteriota bacterium]